MEMAIEMGYWGIGGLMIPKAFRPLCTVLRTQDHGSK